MKIKDGLKKYKKQIFVSIILLLVLAFSIAVYFLAGKPMIEFISNPAEFKGWVSKHGIFAYIAFILMTVFQIIIAFIPGEPFELAAGYAFGAVMGTLLCVIASVIGCMLVLMLTRRFGMPLVELFFGKEKIEKLKFLKNSKRRNIIIFLLFFIPGTPKDIITYFVGLTDIKIWQWLLICSVAKLPSIVTSTVSGGALGQKEYITAVIFLLITALISAIGVLVYKKIVEKHNKNVK